VSRHPEASPPCGRCARWGAARLAASCSTGGAPLPGARWEGGGENVVPTARSGRPPCAVRRVRHALEPIARRVTMGGWLTCWRRCIPLTFRSHGSSVQARTGPFASLTPVASLWPSPARGSSAPTSFRVARRTAVRSITTTPGSGALPGAPAPGALVRAQERPNELANGHGEERLHRRHGEPQPTTPETSLPHRLGGSRTIPHRPETLPLTLFIRLTDRRKAPL
jgi:hypothetical protein